MKHPLKFPIIKNLENLIKQFIKLTVILLVPLVFDLHKTVHVEKSC